MSTSSYRIIFAVVLCLAAVGCRAQKSKIYLLAAGVSQYANESIPVLRMPINDVDTITRIISQRNSEVVVLKNKEATGDSIRHTMERLFAKAGRRDIVMLFFSGHGYTGGFCPYDFNTGGEECCLSYEDVKKILAKSKAYGKFVMADACHSGGLRKPTTVKKDSLGEERIKKSQIMLFLSSRGNESSYETPIYDNGYFTKYLAEAFRGAADADKNGRITAWEMYSYVYKKVVEAVQGRQHPVMWGYFNKRLILMDNNAHAVH